MSFLGILFPERCFKCHRRGTSLCSSCEALLRLAQPLPNHTFAVYAYGEPLVQRAVWELKYHARGELARALAQRAITHLLAYLEDYFQSGAPDRVVWVPIPEHTHKLRRKGFNQASLLASWWSQCIPGSSTKNLLIKTRQTPPQARLNKTARLKNVVNSMQARSLDPSWTYIVVDDVITTGATCTEARRALTARGATKIFFVALAHGYKRN